MNHVSTINPDELAFYEGLAAFWWDRSMNVNYMLMAARPEDGV